MDTQRSLSFVSIVRISKVSSRRNTTKNFRFWNFIFVKPYKVTREKEEKVSWKGPFRLIQKILKSVLKRQINLKIPKRYTRSTWKTSNCDLMIVLSQGWELKVTQSGFLLYIKSKYKRNLLQNLEFYLKFFVSIRLEDFPLWHHHKKRRYN